MCALLFIFNGLIGLPDLDSIHLGPGTMEIMTHVSV